MVNICRNINQLKITCKTFIFNLHVLINAVPINPGESQGPAPFVEPSVKSDL